MDLESCPEQISDKVFQDEHSALLGKRRGGWMVNGGEGGGGLVKENLRRMLTLAGQPSITWGSRGKILW